MAGQVWAVGSNGGYMYSDELSDVMRTALQPLCRFRQLCDAEFRKGLHRGQLFTWNVYLDVSSTGTRLTETATVPSTQFTIVQGTGTIVELGNSVPFTQKLDYLAKHSVERVINKVLKNDAKKVIEGEAYTQFNLTPLRIIASSGTDATNIQLYTNGTVTGTNTKALGTAHIRTIVDTMKERNIPPYVNEDYVCVAHPTTLRPMKITLETLHQYVDTGFRMILRGEIGRYDGVRFIEQNTIAKETWGQNFSNWAYFMGEDTVYEAVTIPEEIRAKLPTDFGRDQALMWYFLGGYALVHTNATQARILKWDTLA